MPTTVTAPSKVETVFEFEVKELRDKFDRYCFLFAHHLSGHPLFEIPQLVEISRKLAEKKALYYDDGDIHINQKWNEIPEPVVPVDESIRRIQEGKTWILLKKVDQFPEYKALLDEGINELQNQLGRDLEKEMKVREVLIFITSPKRIATYHIDRECNFLLQIHGEKDIFIFDKYDRDVLPEQELERFWTITNDSAIYKEQYQSRATTYRLVPGKGVHIPVNAPHWVQNDNNISVSLSLNFQFREEFVANVYRANYHLRRFGLSPTPPGVSPVKDKIKSATYGLRAKIRS
jgi:hypothetical protein